MVDLLHVSVAVDVRPVLGQHAASGGVALRLPQHARVGDGGFESPFEAPDPGEQTTDECHAACPFRARPASSRLPHHSPPAESEPSGTSPRPSSPVSPSIEQAMMVVVPS